MAFWAFTASFISLSLWASVAALWAARAALFASTSSSKALASRPVAALFFACCSFHLAFLSISSSSFLRERSSASFALAASVTASNATWVFGAVVVSLSDSAEFICAISSSLAILEARRTCVAGTGREGGKRTISRPWSEHAVDQGDNLASAGRSRGALGPPRATASYLRDQVWVHHGRLSTAVLALVLETFP